MRFVLLAALALVSTAALAAEQVYQCTYDNGESHATLKVDLHSGRGTLKTDATEQPFALRTSSAVTREFCASMQSEGRDCRDYVILCGLKPEHLDSMRACGANGAMLLNRKDPTQSAIIAGPGSSEARCELK